MAVWGYPRIIPENVRKFCEKGESMYFELAGAIILITLMVVWMFTVKGEGS